MKIAQLIWSLELGGAERQVASLAPALRRAGDEASVLCLTRRGLFAAEVEASDVPVTLIDRRRRIDPGLAPRIAGILRAHRIDLLHTHLFTANLWGTMAARLAGIPVIITEHGPRIFREKPLQLAITRRLSRLADAVQVVSQELLELFGPLRPRRLEFISLGFDGQRVHRSAPLETVPWDASAVPIGTFCRLVPEKEVTTFVRALACVRERQPNVVGVIVGDGPERAAIEALIHTMGLGRAFYLLGQRTDPIRILKRMRVAVLTSRWEGIPVALLEAMAAGIPVVATATEGARSLITDGVDGRLAPVGNPEALAAQIAAQIERPLRPEPGIRKVQTDYALEPHRLEQIRQLYTALAAR